MADHYFSMKVGETGKCTSASVTVDTSTTAGSKIELRITDGSAKAVNVINFLEWLADCFRARNPGVVPVDMLTD